MKLRLYGIAVAAVAAGFLAFGGTRPALAACTDDVAALTAEVEKEQDTNKKQMAQQELEAAKTSAGAQDEVACKEHLDRAREHLKK